MNFKVRIINAHFCMTDFRFAAFFIEHNVPFNTADHLLKLIKSFDPKSEAIQRMSCCRTKLTSLIKSVIGQYAFDSLIDNLKKKKFSLIVDESTDVGTQKNLVVLVRYHNDAHVVVDQFLALLKVNLHYFPFNMKFKEVKNFRKTKCSLLFVRLNKALLKACTLW